MCLDSNVGSLFLGGPESPLTAPVSGSLMTGDSTADSIISDLVIRVGKLEARLQADALIE